MQKMGRPPIRKSGAMTAAERMRRYRKKLKQTANKAREKERLGDLTPHEYNAAKNRAFRDNPTAQWRKAAIDAQCEIAVLQSRLRLYEQVPMHDASGPADEIARQIAECMMECPGMTIDDVRAAIDRRWGPAV